MQEEKYTSISLYFKLERIIRYVDTLASSLVQVMHKKRYGRKIRIILELTEQHGVLSVLCLIIMLFKQSLMFC